MNIILIGYRGCGKTTLGKRLAEELWKTYADVDVVTAKRFGTDSIAEIWATHGEPAWRAAEVQVTAELVAKPDMVIGLGGGTLMQPAAREAVTKAADTRRIYLKCDADVLFQRISADSQTAKTRPALTNLGGGIEEVRAVLAQREPVYEAVADKVFDVTHLSPPDAVRYIIERCL
jgi:shikimate kinase